MARHFEVIREARYERELAEISQGLSRVDQFQKGLELTLGCKPEWGNAVRGTRFRVWPLNIGKHRFAVYYTFDNQIVRLVSVWKVPPDRGAY